MTALTKDRNTPKRAGYQKSIPVAEGVKIFAGSQVCTNAAGYAVPGANVAGYKFAGIAQEYIDNSAGLDGELSIVVEQPVIVSLGAANITQADIGKPVFISDDQTVALSTTNSIACGVIREVISATAVWVDTFYCFVSGTIAAVDAAAAEAAAEGKVVAADAAEAAGAAPTAEEFAAVVTLVNELKALVTDAPNKIEFDAVVTLANANKTTLNELIASLKVGRLVG